MPDAPPNPPPNPPPADDRSKWIPPDAHAAVVAELERLKPALEGVKTEFAAAQAAWSQERAGLAAGLDAEGLSVAKLVYGSQPADKRPPFDAWLAEQKAKPSKALSPWFAAPTTPQPAQPAAPPSGVVPPPAPGAAAVPPPALPAPGGVPAGNVDAIIQEAIRTGDWSKYNAIRHTLIRPAR